MNWKAFVSNYYIFIIYYWHFISTLCRVYADLYRWSTWRRSPRPLRAALPLGSQDQYNIVLSSDITICLCRDPCAIFNTHSSRDYYVYTTFTTQHYHQHGNEEGGGGRRIARDVISTLLRSLPLLIIDDDYEGRGKEDLHDTTFATQHNILINMVMKQEGEGDG